MVLHMDKPAYSDAERLRDEIAILEYRSGNVDSLGALISRWQPRLHAYLRVVLRDSHAVWDVSQDIWLAVVAALGRKHDIRSFPSWLFAIAHNKAVSRFASRRREDDGDPLPEAAQSDDCLTLVISAENATLLKSCIRELPDAQREAIALFYTDGLTVDEVAVIQNAPVGTIQTRLFHARRKLRDMLASKGYTDER